MTRTVRRTATVLILLPLAIRVTGQFGSAPLAHSFCNSYIFVGSSRTTMCCGRSVNEVRARVFKGILHMFVNKKQPLCPSCVVLERANNK